MTSFHNFISLTLLIFISAFKIYSQPYQSVFGKDSTSWYTHVHHFDGSHTEQYNCYNEDSVINGISYKIVYGYKRTYPVFFLLEDTMNGELWMKHIPEGDILLMTLSLAIGDSFVTYLHGKPQEANYVTSVYKDSLNRKVIQFKQKHYRPSSFPDSLNYPDSNIMFIEGVGPSTGIALGMLDININELLCVYKNEVKTHGSLYYKGACFVQYGAVNESVKHNSIHVYPNPVSNKINIEQSYLPNQISRAKIYDVQGNLQLSVQVEIANEIDVASLKPGIYFLYLEYKLNSNIKPIKLIKL